MQERKNKGAGDGVQGFGNAGAWRRIRPVICAFGSYLKMITEVRVEPRIYL